MPAPKGNKYAIGNNGGRPALYSSVKDLIRACDKYFAYIKGESHLESKGRGKNKKEVTVWTRYPEPATITGLTLFLGFADRCSLDDYEKKQEFSHIIKKARARVEHEYEKRLHADKNTGAIFALKNMGWQDKVSQEVTGAGGKDLIPQPDLSKLSDDELRTIVELQRKLGVSKA